MVARNPAFIVGLSIVSRDIHRLDELESAVDLLRTSGYVDDVIRRLICDVIRPNLRRRHRLHEFQSTVSLSEDSPNQLQRHHHHLYCHRRRFNHHHHHPSVH